MEDLKGFEGIYTINKQGQVWRVKTQYLLTPCKNKNGYLQHLLYKEGNRKNYQLHRLVALQFIPNPNNLPQIDHIDHNKLNNSLDNLRWVSARQNDHNKIYQPKSGHKNICIREGRKSPFVVAIVYEKKCYSKSFKSLEDALDYRNNF